VDVGPWPRPSRVGNVFAWNVEMSKLEGPELTNLKFIPVKGNGNHAVCAIFEFLLLHEMMLLHEMDGRGPS
jgi:hypothetical protein